MLREYGWPRRTGYRLSAVGFRPADVLAFPSKAGITTIHAITFCSDQNGCWAERRQPKADSGFLYTAEDSLQLPHDRILAILGWLQSICLRDARIGYRPASPPSDDDLPPGSRVDDLLGAAGRRFCRVGLPMAWARGHAPVRHRIRG